ncbi:MAG: nitrate reductase subunit alpha, partial [Acetobacteraceae bacterium]|nr:nitrate reductase subunit alpha [Acetobacteraceae bacterium]
MSHFLDRLGFFKRPAEPFANGHGQVVDEPRGWEEAYRARWATDKIVRSTHGVNCTGSCSWKIHVKGGVVTWETQHTDYPRTRPGLPNHEPRGCARGASYSWYLYSANRVKHPMMRKRLLKLWRAARAEHADPVKAWASIQSDEAQRREYQKVRGMGGFVRVTWEEAEEMIAAANIHTAKAHGPDRVIGFSPIPAMSMVSYAAGSRYLSLIGGVCMSFYDWYCDLPPSSPQTWGEQTDVPESADWYNAGFLMMWGSNVPQTRTPDAHFMTEARYRGAKTVVVTPDYSEASKFADLWLHPKQGTDAALAMAMGHVILSEWHARGKGDYFLDYCRRYTDMPMLVLLEERDGRLVGGRQLRTSDLEGALGEANNTEWKTVAIDDATGRLYAPTGSIGFRWGEQGKWNLEGRDARTLEVTNPRLSLLGEEEAEVAFPYFGARAPEFFNPTSHEEIVTRRVPVRRVTLADGSTRLAATVYDLFLANYGVARDGSADYDADAPYTPAWAAKVCGIRAADIVTTAREFAANADKTHGKSMVILGAAVNHWYHGDMIYRGIINLLVMCGCIGQSGGGWSHYVGQEKLRPQTGWVPLAFATDWGRPPRQMNSTSFFYAHTGQYRYEKLGIDELLSPTAPAALRGALIDFNVRAERMGWLPSAPQLQQNPLRLAAAAAAAGVAPAEYVAAGLKDGSLRMSCEDPENPANWPRNLFIWRSNLLGSSGKGHEYFLKHLLGTTHGVQGKDLGEEGGSKPEEITWRDAPQGKLDLLVTLDFRMSTTCMYSDIVLPTATWYEKHDLNTSDMHPFIHPLSAAVDPAWESRTDWAIFRGIARRFSELAPGHLGVEKDVVLAPLMHDTAQELAQGCLDGNVR